MQALLAEVRQLRAALEQSAIAIPRIQILLQRTQLQQNRVDRLSVRLQEFRSRMNGVNADDARLAAEVKEAEARLGQEQDPVRRRDLAATIEAVREQLQRTGPREQQERAQENELAGELNSERAKLDELERQLRALETALPGTGTTVTPRELK